MAKLTVAFVDALIKQVTRGDISFSRMVELLNEGKTVEPMSESKIRHEINKIIIRYHHDNDYKTFKATDDMFNLLLEFAQSRQVPETTGKGAEEILKPSLLSSDELGTDDCYEGMLFVTRGKAIEAMEEFASQSVPVEISDIKIEKELIIESGNDKLRLQRNVTNCISIEIDTIGFPQFILEYNHIDQLVSFLIQQKTKWYRDNSQPVSQGVREELIKAIPVIMLRYQLFHDKLTAHCEDVYSTLQPFYTIDEVVDEYLANVTGK